MYRPTQYDIDIMCADHISWLDTAGRTGARADLSCMDVSGMDLKGWDFTSVIYDSRTNFESANISTCIITATWLFHAKGAISAALRSSSSQENIYIAYETKIGAGFYLKACPDLQFKDLAHLMSSSNGPHGPHGPHSLNIDDFYRLFEHLYV